MDALFSLAVGLLPVLLFLVVLIALDSYKLLKLTSVLWMLAMGAVVAQTSLFVNTAVLRAGAGTAWLDTVFMSRYIAPLVEEGLKGSVIVFLLKRNRIGFLVDSAVRGFAVGAGFAAVENVYYFLALEDTRLILWIIRGLGTAIMHGGVTAVMAVISKHLVDLDDSTSLRAWLPGMALAAVIHSSFNHFILPPVQSTMILVIVLPGVLLAVFRYSERSTRRWLGVGFDTDSELLEMLNSGRMSQTRIGEYLVSLRERFDPEMLVDMICLIRLHLELSVKAKGILLAREAGFDLPPDPATREQFDELRHLEANIGRTGNLALKPIFNMSSRDLWQFYLLGDR